jgi:hypothetical protein
MQKQRFVALIRQQTGEIHKNYYFGGHNEEITVREADSDTAMFFPLSAESQESSVRARVCQLIPMNPHRSRRLCSSFYAIVIAQSCR